ncbi:MAG TPA: SIMPL domain-containing protein [Kiritimatiellia bacterium]|nr:SIMPL domain-containing protein [Kiritimatiellia bacterium]HPS08832.1 SIMPL domain-containing protein [Kiritimatiellia bacterium]
MNSVVKLSVVAVILALGMILSSTLLSKLFVRVRHEQAISVKGYAEKNIVSDIGKFSCTCTARGTSLNASYGRLQTSRAAALDYLKRKGFRDEEIVPGTIQTSKVFKRDAQGKETNEIEYYDAFQSLAVASGNVALIRDAATGITDLIKDGVDISASEPAFYVSDLQGTKLGLLAAATLDGQRRAAALADNGGGRVGALISARQGVFQITERNSTDTSGTGEYDTSAIEKTAKAIVTLEYAIDATR